MKVRTKLIGTLVLALGIAAPAAHAERPDDRAGLRGPGAIEAVQTTVSQHPDNRAGLRGPGAAAAPSSSSHPDNRADARGPGAFTTLIARPSSDGFDWGDALIGGLGGVGTALLLTGCFFLLMGQRSRARVA
jgi:hypothetical protein